MISRIALEPVGERLLLRLAVENAALDVLTDSASLVRARQLLEAPDPVFAEAPLGSFGHFPVTLSIDAMGNVAIALDGPDLGAGVSGNQAAVFYSTRSEATELFRIEPGARPG